MHNPESPQFLHRFRIRRLKSIGMEQSSKEKDMRIENKRQSVDNLRVPKKPFTCSGRISIAGIGGPPCGADFSAVLPKDSEEHLSG
jgi:hypothetical protein